jgi:signal transduction histidine kinase/predicted RNA-binding protein with RPS1 domain/CheY-like chemotaxis protein
MLSSYPINSTVSVRITRAIPPGLLGRVVEEDRSEGPKAIVRTREIAWDEPSPVADYIGRTLPAIVIGYNPAYEELELSLRLAQRDPWKRIEARYAPGQAVDGRVIGLAEQGAFVELEPGVEGYLPISELVQTHVERIEDWLWIDDSIKACVTRIDAPRRRLGLSIRQRVKERDERTRRELWASRRGTPSDNITVAELIPTDVRLKLLRLDGEEPVVFEPQLRVLIIEDDETYAEGLNSLLRRNGCQVTWAPDGAQGLATFREQDEPFDLIVVDWNLPGIKGDQLVDRLRQESERSRLAMILEPAPLVEQPGMLDLLRDLGIDVFTKEDGEQIREGLFSILEDIRANGSDRRPQRSLYFPDQIAPQEGGRTGEFDPILPQKGGVLLAGQHGSLEEVLERLRRNTRAAAVVVLRLDAGQRRLETEASVGSSFPIEEAGRDLIYSPLIDVVQKGEWIHERVKPTSKKYQRLLDLLPFEGFLGIPVPAVGAVHYGLIALKARSGFGRQQVQMAQCAAYLIGSILQGRHLNQSLLVWQAQSLVGRMVSSVIHEINNKLGAIQFLVEDVQGSLRELGRWPEKAQDASFMRTAQEAAEAIAVAQSQAYELRNQYLNLTASDEPQQFDLEALAQSIKHVLRVEAQQYNILLDVRLTPGACDAPGRSGAPGLPGGQSGLGAPSIYARPSRLRQILMNLSLNAIQHIAELGRPGSLSIEIGRCPEAHLPLQVRFIDNGPGIHRQLWERIFEFGFTTKKGGAGLGLTISRHAAESLGGRLAVESSDMLWGTTFLLELPEDGAQ